MAPDDSIEPQPQPGVVQLQPWGADIQHIANAEGGKKIYALIISRNFGERLVFTGPAEEITNVLETIGAKLRQLESGIVIAAANTPLPPLNGKPPR